MHAKEGSRDRGGEVHSFSPYSSPNPLRKGTSKIAGSATFYINRHDHGAVPSSKSKGDRGRKKENTDFQDMLWQEGKCRGERLVVSGRFYARELSDKKKFQQKRGFSTEPGGPCKKGGIINNKHLYLSKLLYKKRRKGEELANWK